MRLTYLFVFTIYITLACSPGKNKDTDQPANTKADLQLLMDSSGEQLKVYKKTNPDTPLLVQVVEAQFRPYLHPIVAPDGQGILTEKSPDHHQHQTGIYWGFTRVNQRDFFHNPGADHWKKVAVNIIKNEGENVSWQTVYEMLDSLGKPLMTETQTWNL